MISLRTPQAIATALFDSTDILSIATGHDWPALEISADCVLLNWRQAQAEAKGRDVPLAELGQSWWIFAASGNGDAWLMSLDGQQRIAFLDHDQGADALPQPMGIIFAQWLQMADVMYEWEQADEEGLAKQVLALMDEISPGLGKRFPYRIDDL